MGGSLALATPKEWPSIHPMPPWQLPAGGAPVNDWRTAPRKRQNKPMKRAFQRSCLVGGRVNLDLMSWAARVRDYQQKHWPPLVELKNASRHREPKNLTVANVLKSASAHAVPSCHRVNQHNGRKRQRRFGLRSGTFSIEIWFFKNRPTVGGTTKLVFVRTFTHLPIFWMAGYNPYPCEFTHTCLIGNKIPLFGQGFPRSGAISTRLDRKECA